MARVYPRWQGLESKGGALIVKKFVSVFLGLSLVLGCAPAFGMAPAQTDQPKAEKSKKKGGKQGDKAKQQSGRKKTEQPKAQ